MKKLAKSTTKRLFLALLSIIFAFSFFFNSISPVFAENTTEPEQSNTTLPENATAEEIGQICLDESGAVGWLVCPNSGLISKAVDGIYTLINDFLVLEPISSDTTAPTHIIWDYVRNISNILFIIFLLIVVYSQITGFGINNYGIKRILPKLIITAILVNVSFFLCQILVDISNIAGNSVREVLNGIEQSILAEGATLRYDVSWTNLMDLFITGGAASALGIASTGGLAATFFALVPLLLGALVSVVIGLITIALRQAVVIILVLSAPLAFIANLFPNTEVWFKKWKQLFSRMLIFFPAFSALYGVSSLTGWAIISTSESALGIIIGLAVKVYPFFASVSLMKMSGTVLGTLNQKLHSIAAKPLASASRSALERKAYYQSKYLSSRPRGIAQETIQRIQDRNVQEAEDIKRYRGLALSRALAKDTEVVDENGHITRHAEEVADITARSLEYRAEITRNTANFDKGLSMIENAQVGTVQARRLEMLDNNTVEAADHLKYELARNAKISYDNTVGYNTRTQNAINAHLDSLHEGDSTYQMHDLPGSVRASALRRYNTMKDVMDGNVEDTHFIAADAAQTFGAQAGAIQKKFESYFSLTAPTQDVEHRLAEITKLSDSTNHIDEYISGLRILNQRGDTDLVKKHLEEALIDMDGESKIRLGTYASQALANFLMFDVKDGDPFLRRYGKYINLETARVYNTGDYDSRRHNDALTFNEYITGDYKEYDKNGNIVPGKSKRTAKILLEGTSFKGIERTGYANMIQSIRDASRDKNGRVDQEKCERLEDEIFAATLSNLVGDSQSYLSGSEQIMSFTQFMTGIKKDKNGKYVEDFLDLDPTELASMTEEEKEAILAHKREYYKNRTDKFINAHVPSQMGRFKSDIFAGARQLYRDLAKGNLKDSELTEYNALSSDTDKEAYLDEHGAKQYFKDAIKPKTYEYLKKMYTRGYLSDAKAPISAYLDLDKQPKENQNQKQNQTNPNPEPTPSADVAPLTPLDPLSASRNAVYADANIELDNLFSIYNNNVNRNNVTDFLSEAIDNLTDFGLDSSTMTEIDNLRMSINTHTDVSTVYRELKNILNK